VHARLRTVAAADIDSAIAHYRETAGPDVAVRFVDEFENAISLLIRYPLTGSLRFAYELEIPELRSWSLKKFPYMIFYVPNDEHLDIWRVLHARRDVPTFLHDDNPEPDRSSVGD